MELQQLRYLVALSRTLNFSKAAEELFISQPTLSQQIRKLEEELGVKLIERSTRSVKMTPIGARCVDLAQQAVDAANRMQEITQEEKRRSSKKLNIGVLAVYPQLNISSIIAEYQALHLNETVNMYFGWSVDLLDRLRRKKSDVIITNLDEVQLSQAEIASWDIHPFLEDQLYLVVGENSPVYERKVVGMEEVLSQQLFMPGSRSSANIFFAKAIQNAGYGVPEFNECPSIMSTFNFVATGRGATVMSKHVSQPYLREGMKLISITPTIKTYTAIVLRKESLGRPVIREFRDFFLQRALEGAAG
ncbi:MAG: LysR family transcriptional regulator [Clostridia bacterium]|nr:LysR family transcriptional regulator [Clostridia bacterium]